MSTAKEILIYDIKQLMLALLPEEMTREESGSEWKRIGWNAYRSKVIENINKEFGE